MTEKSTEKVEIFGQEYKIKGVGNPQYIQKIARYVDKKMREIAHSSGIMSQSRITESRCAMKMTVLPFRIRFRFC